MRPHVNYDDGKIATGNQVRVATHRNIPVARSASLHVGLCRSHYVLHEVSLVDMNANTYEFLVDDNAPFLATTAYVFVPLLLWRDSIEDGDVVPCI